MMRNIKRAIALPVRLSAKITSLVPIFDTTPLWSAAWKLGGAPEDGGKLLICLYRKYGIELARETAEAMIRQTRSSLIVSTMCTIELNSYQGAEAVNKWVRMAKQEMCEGQEMLLHQELLLSYYLEGYDDKKIIEDILSRNDLPMPVTLIALIAKAYGFLAKRLWDEAEEIADRILGVQEEHRARLIKWVVCQASGEQEEAEKHFAIAKGKLPDARFCPLVAQGWLFLGQAEKAMEWLFKAGTLGAELTELRSPIGVLARSEEFKDFCRGREK